MKVIAFYLPQFHSIPENDKWWGEGFTEWTNVRKSKPQFIGHNQPEIPYNNNYYNLLDERVQVQQSEMAIKYGINAFCYYHYWFEGKLLLEKPMENMINNENVKIPFCICWANETWARTWDGKEEDILIKQNYNENKEAWKKHFDYLVKFFKDDRYLKHNGMPILLIYKPHLIQDRMEMLNYWRKLAKDAGFLGLYIGYQNPTAFEHNMEKSGFDFGVEFEPLYTMKEIENNTKGIGRKISYSLKNPRWFINGIKTKLFNKPRIYNYDSIWRKILRRKPICNNIIPGAFTSWDNTPRKGNASIVFYGSTPEKFKKYFENQVRRAKEVYNSEYIFINAWNEWAEGAHLEPDEVNGYGYLEAVKEVKGRLE